jgi:hypothetical protein
LNVLKTILFNICANKIEFSFDPTSVYVTQFEARTIFVKRLREVIFSLFSSNKLSPQIFGQRKANESWENDTAIKHIYGKFNPTNKAFCFNIAISTLGL